MLATRSRVFPGQGVDRHSSSPRVPPALSRKTCWKADPGPREVVFRGNRLLAGQVGASALNANQMLLRQPAAFWEAVTALRQPSCSSGCWRERGVLTPSPRSLLHWPWAARRPRSGRVGGTSLGPGWCPQQEAAPGINRGTTQLSAGAPPPSASVTLSEEAILPGSGVGGTRPTQLWEPEARRKAGLAYFWLSIC